MIFHELNSDKMIPHLVILPIPVFVVLEGISTNKRPVFLDVRKSIQWRYCPKAGLLPCFTFAVVWTLLQSSSNARILSLSTYCHLWARSFHVFEATHGLDVWLRLVSRLDTNRAENRKFSANQIRLSLVYTSCDQKKRHLWYLSQSSLLKSSRHPRKFEQSTHFASHGKRLLRIDVQTPRISANVNKARYRPRSLRPTITSASEHSIGHNF